MFKMVSRILFRKQFYEHRLLFTVSNSFPLQADLKFSIQKYMQPNEFSPSATSFSNSGHRDETFFIIF